jgi:hypothetical protein
MVYLTTGQRATDQRAMDQEKAKLVLMKVPVDTPGPMMEGEMKAQVVEEDKAKQSAER